MLQNQYYNSKLTKDHIEKILTNYSIKYNTMKNEIDAKFNSMIKLFINDIKAFLENIEDISKERKKIKEAENHEMEIALLKSKLEEKNKNERHLRMELELLTKENQSLQKKIKFKEQIIRNKTLNIETPSIDKRTKTEFNPNKNKYKKYTTGNKTTRREKTKNYNMSLDIKTRNKRPINNKFPQKSNHLDLNFEKNNDVNNSKYAKTKAKQKKILNNSMDKRIINKKSNLNEKIALTEKNPLINSNQETKSSSNIQKGKNKNMIDDEKLITVEMPFSDQSFVENESFTTDELLDEEIKELEMEEENIILLMNKIKQIDNNV